MRRTTRWETHMKTYLRISGLLFAVIALLHVIRLSLHWSAQIAGWTVPSWVSWMAVVATGALAVWALRLARQARSLP